MMTNGVTAGSANASLDLSGVIASRLSKLDPSNLANDLLTRVQNGENLGQMFDEIKGQLSPVDQGNVLRQLDQSGSTGLLAQNRFPLSGDFDLGKGLRDIVNGAVDLGKQSIGWLNQKAKQINDKLATLPGESARALSDSMRGPNARALTSGEQSRLAKIFSNRSIDLSNVRIVNGPGNNPAAAAAFLKGNPAITVGNTVYVKSDKYSADFSKTAKGVEVLAHEFTHVDQYQRLGFKEFGKRYGNEFVKAGGNATEMYNYASRRTTFKTETLEGQAQMVGRYAEYKAGGQNLTPAEVKDVENRLKGTGFFGL
jgi:Domain of unknown function (DUF4157)